MKNKADSCDSVQVYQNGETEEDPEQFLNALNSSVEIFVNRMRSNSQRGRSIATDSSVQSLFNVISNMHPQLMKYVQGQEDFRGIHLCKQKKKKGEKGILLFSP